MGSRVHSAAHFQFSKMKEGIGIFDKNRTSNIQAANNDVAHSKDSRLQEQVISKSAKVPTGIKR